MKTASSDIADMIHRLESIENKIAHLELSILKKMTASRKKTVSLLPFVHP